MVENADAQMEISDLEVSVENSSLYLTRWLALLTRSIIENIEILILILLLLYDYMHRALESKDNTDESLCTLAARACPTLLTTSNPTET